MSRRVRYDEIRAEALARAVEVRLRAGLDTRKDQPHDDAFWEAEFRAAQARLARLIADGRWTFVGPRRVIWR